MNHYPGNLVPSSTFRAATIVSVQQAGPAFLFLFFVVARVCVCWGGGGGSSCFVQWLLGVVPGLRDDPSQRSGGSIGPQTPNTCLRHPPWKKVGGIESEAWGVPSDRLRVQTVYG